NPGAIAAAFTPLLAQPLRGCVGHTRRGCIHDMPFLASPSSRRGTVGRTYSPRTPKSRSRRGGRGSRAFFGQMCYPMYTQAQLLTLVHVEGIRDGEETLTMAPHGTRATARGPTATLI